MINVKELAKKLKRESRVAIFCHIRPDGDAIGSAAALTTILKRVGVRAEFFCSDVIPARFRFLPNLESGNIKPTGEYSALVAVDCADIIRLGDYAEYFSVHKNTFNIDHHVSNTRYAKLNYVSDRAANCEIVYEIAEALGVPISYEIATLLLTGILTDTGGFRHKNVKAETLSIAAVMVNAKADINYISYKMFTEQSKERAKLFGIVMSKIRFFSQGRVAVASVHKKDIELSGAREDETEGFIDFVMGIAGVEAGACVLETEVNKYKISFRSKGADVNAVAGIFGGGGHTLASGCRINGEYEEVVDKITVALDKYLP